MKQAFTGIGVNTVIDTIDTDHFDVSLAAK